MKKIALSICALLLLSALTAIGASEMIFLNILDMKSGPPNKVGMVVSVLDEKGAPIKGLGPANFKLSIEGKEISNFSLKPIASPQSPLSVILAIDISGSMKGAPISEAKKAASIFLDQLDNADHIALVGFGGSVKLLADFTTKKYEVREKLQNLAANEKWTWLYQATYDCLEKGAKAPTSRVAIVLLTDGKDEGSPRTDEDVLARIKGTQIPIYALGFGGDAQVQYLKRIASASGGFFLYTPNPEELSQLYAMVLDQIKNQYLLEFFYDNPAGVYNATLKFDYRGQEVSAQRRFIHISAEPPQPAAPPVQRGPAAPVSTGSTNAWLWVPLALIVAIVGGSLAYFYRQRRTAPVRRTPSEPVGPEPVSLMLHGKIHPLTPASASSRASRATVILQSPGEVGLRIDVPPMPAYFPLMDKKDNKDYEEVIISRYDEESAGFFSQDASYLLLADNTVSRPDENRLGHARIFLDPETHRYQVEDLGSTSGTRLGENALEGKAFLENRDTITIGAVVINFYDKRPTTETKF